MQGPNDAETSPLLGLKHGGSRDRARRYFFQPIRLQNAYLPLLVCCFITGLIDAGSYNAWRVFMSMQTGVLYRTLEMIQIITLHRQYDFPGLEHGQPSHWQ